MAKLTLSPDTIEGSDVHDVRVQGVNDHAISDAIHVCALFNMIDRCADALGFEVPIGHPGRYLLDHGYLGMGS
ncbi:MAG: hypothetical protein DLM70_16140 [Chloroflexi bacterium]|nr:MAG: hypothetical protein DLM70_16140 [Chloroflexota bacterium]